MNTRYAMLLSLLAIWGFHNFAKAQNDNPCLTIQSILVDACAPGGLFFGEEGRNEMVRFKVGDQALNTSTINVNWASTLQWQGLRGPDQTTASKTAELNATIQACGLFLEPVNGVLPANSTVLLITSYLVSATSNSFAGLSDTVYVLYQNSTATGGHVLNYVANPNPDEQTVRIDFAGGCFAQVTYRRSLLVTQQGTPGAEDGATVLFEPNGLATYINNGCVAPIIPLSPNWELPNGDGLLCQNDSPLNLNNLITGTPNGTWSGEAVSNGFFNPEGLNGTYPVTYTVGVGSCEQSRTQNIVVNLPANPEWNAPEVLCAGDNVLINLNDFITGTEGGNFFGQGVQNNILNTTGLVGPVDITYRVGVGTCQAFSTRTILLIDIVAPVMNTDKNKYCQNESPFPIVVDAPQGTEVLWFNSPELTTEIASGNQFIPEANITATYYSVIKAGNCISDADSLTITFVPFPDALSGPFDFTYCEGEPIPLISFSSEDLITWFADEATTEILNIGNTYQPIAGQNIIYVTVENELCVSPVYDISVNEVGLITAIIDLQGETVLCKGESATLISNFETGNIWSDNQTTQSINVSATGWYILTVNGLCNVSKDSIFIDNQSVIADFDANPLFGNAPLQVNLSNQSSNADSFTWLVNGMQNNPVNNSYLLNEAGLYNIMLIAENEFGCIDTASKLAEVVNNEVSLVIPNSFTPNGDGFNDLFTIKSTSIQSLRAVIFNRWGQQVIEWSGVNNSWDGTINGRNSPEGVYFYIITAKDLLGNEIVKQGDVTLIR
jgi:gliding motility-associated-like protein